jgi:hypothetical protein
MAGGHVVDSLRDSHRPTVETYGLISGGQGIAQQILLMVELG